MGTRSDFYIGRGESAEWIGSIAWDGYPSGINQLILRAKTAKTFRKHVAAMAESRDDFTKPEQGWPWPWSDSKTSDYAYAFDGDQVYMSCFGSTWKSYTEYVANGKVDDEDFWGEAKEAVFPDMSNKQAVTYGKRSGLIVVSNGRLVDDEK